ncbi:hypothetical protein D3C84_836820 [compost metagenome]
MPGAFSRTGATLSPSNLYAIDFMSYEALCGRGRAAFRFSRESFPSSPQKNIVAKAEHRPAHPTGAHKPTGKLLHKVTRPKFAAEAPPTRAAHTADATATANPLEHASAAKFCGCSWKQAMRFSERAPCHHLPSNKSTRDRQQALACLYKNLYCLTYETKPQVH